MRGRRITEAVGAIAGAALVGLLFLPWWKFDPARLRRDGGWTAYVIDPLEISAWWAVRHGDLVWVATGLLWIATGLLAIALAIAGGSGRRERHARLLRRGVAVAGAISLIAAVVRIADPPDDFFSPTPVAYAGAALIAAIAISAAAGLRRA